MAQELHGTEGEAFMCKRILKTLFVAVVVAVAIPVSSALAVHVTDSGGPVVVSPHQSYTPVASEISTGLSPAVSTSNSVASEISTGLQVQSSGTSSVVASSDDGFNWSYAGIGAGVLFASLLVATAGVLTLRRRHYGPLAH